MSSLTADAVICGAGLAGISTAFHLSVRSGIRDIIIVDEGSPLALTSDKSTECYRNWWPGPGSTMVRFMNRSIDLLEELADESGNYFSLNRRGYIFLTADPDRVKTLEDTAAEISALGAGPIRRHDRNHSSYQPSPPEGFHGMPTGADIVIGADLIRRHYSFLSADVRALLHPRRCGWLSAQQLGMYMLNRAREQGTRFISGKVTGVTTEKNRIRTVRLRRGNEEISIETGIFVNAAGPMIQEVGRMIDVDLPVFNELHGKVAFNDTEGILPRDLPLMIWSDPVNLPWTEEEKSELAADDETRWLLDVFPSGVHFRPEGVSPSQVLLLLWTYDVEIKEPVFPPTFDQAHPEIVLRGLSRMVPGLEIYFNRMGKPSIDGGYYCKTQENRPLICPLPVEGAYLVGALSGFGVMACQAAGELIAGHISGSTLPDYAPLFQLERYDDPAYKAFLSELDATTGQL